MQSMCQDFQIQRIASGMHHHALPAAGGAGFLNGGGGDGHVWSGG